MRGYICLQKEDSEFVLLLFWQSSVVVVVCCFVLVLIFVFVPAVLSSEKIYHKFRLIPDDNAGKIVLGEENEDSHSRCSAVLDELILLVIDYW